MTQKVYIQKFRPPFYIFLSSYLLLFNPFVCKIRSEGERMGTFIWFFLIQLNSNYFNLIQILSTKDVTLEILNISGYTYLFLYAFQ